MRRSVFAPGVLLCLTLAFNAFGQSGNATLGGTVADATNALIPGVSVNATNTETGITSTTLTNEAGVYQFPVVQPGVYKVSAELTGFKTSVYNQVQLGVGQQVRLNFSLQVGAVTQSVSVTSEADTLIASTSASVGSVLPEYKVRDLPLAQRNVLELVATAPNVAGSSFAGAPAGMAITTRDGISVNDGRYNNGVFSATVASPDLVEEVRVIVTPADAALGRGAGQVQMQTRSGTNRYTGSVFVTNRNSVLDASTFANNFNGVGKNYINRNDFGARVGGPIKKNKTFFFFLYEGLQFVTKVPVTTTVLTSTAKQGLFRFYPGVQSANAVAVKPTVDLAGNPVTPAGATGPLTTINVFTRDPLRPVADPTGLIAKQLALLPLPNVFTSGDGLNTAGYQWIRRSIGSEGNTGTGTDLNWNQVNLRIDHNFNPNHKLSLVGSDQRTRSDLGQAGVPTPSLGVDINGESNRHPVVYTAQFVSTLSSRVVNEARMGLRRGRAENVEPYDMPGKVGTAARSLMGNIGGIPYIIHSTNFATTLINDGNSSIGSRSPLWTFGDDVSWTQGKHAFKAGGEIRFGYQWSWNSDEIIPHINLGPTSRTAQYFQASSSLLGVPVTGIDNVAFPGLQTADAQNARNLLTDLAGSVAQISEAFSLCGSSAQIKFLDYNQCYKKSRDFREKEFTGYLKDDWKIRQNLTLNFGVRWEWFGVVHEKNGLMAMPVGGSAGLFGISGTGWEAQYRPGLLAGSLTTPEFVDSGSPNPKLQLFPDDFNNFAPAIGFSWTLPWLGKDKTVLRGGYGWSYQGLGTTGGGLTFDTGPGLFPGMNQFASDPTGTYRNLTNLALPVPQRYPDGALQITPLTSRNEVVSTWDNGLVNPYIQNFNLGIQRELVKNLTLEVGYVGSKGSKLYTGINLNTPVTVENGIMDAFKITQAGGNAPLFDTMLKGLNLGSGVVNGTTVTGSASLRSSSSTKTFLANGDVGGLANYFNTTTNFTNVAGGILRNGGLPENFVVVNPQFTSATMNGNSGNSTYHALNVAVNKRLSHGFTTQTTYTWSKALGTATGSDPRNRQINGKTLTTADRTNSLRSNGTFELPFGPNRAFLSKAPAVVERLVERWQFGAIFSMNSGAPVSFTAAGSPFLSGGTNYPDMIAPVSKGLGKVNKNTGTAGVVTYFDGLTQVADPGKANITTLQSLQGANSNLAIQNASGQIILQNPALGTIGNMGPLWIRGPGSIGLDANLIKRVKVAENQEVELRLDALNVLNHPNWGNPTTNINSTSFGRISLPTTGNRQFTFNARYSF